MRFVGVRVAAGVRVVVRVVPVLGRRSEQLRPTALLDQILSPAVKSRLTEISQSTSINIPKASDTAVWSSHEYQGNRVVGLVVEVSAIMRLRRNIYQWESSGS